MQGFSLIGWTRLECLLPDFMAKTVLLRLSKMHFALFLIWNNLMICSFMKGVFRDKFRLIKFRKIASRAKIDSIRVKTRLDGKNPIVANPATWKNVLIMLGGLPRLLHQLALGFMASFPV